jgi:hypothetical protein
MRDLRRYGAPVTINNPKQVIIAANGGQQVNVQNKRRAKNRNRKKASNKPKAILKGTKYLYRKSRYKITETHVILRGAA